MGCIWDVFIWDVFIWNVFIVGEWENDGPCTPIWDVFGHSSSCGPGHQKQKRTCSDGTGNLKCTDEEQIQERIVRCIDANTTLPDCPGKS